jgi:hypothetical protein
MPYGEMGRRLVWALLVILVLELVAVVVIAVVANG